MLLVLPRVGASHEPNHGPKLDLRKVVIVGGVAGGASTAARLRRLDETAEISIFEKGGFVSFANCGEPELMLAQRSSQRRDPLT